MNQKKIDTFFTELSKKIKKPTKIILTGGTVANLYGSSRITHDIDFEIKSAEKPEYILEGIRKSEKIASVDTEFSEDIDHWSMISYLDYRKHTIPYKKFGFINVQILEPEYWSIGKVARYYQSDIDDMMVVFQIRKTKPEKLAKIWETALKESPLSDRQFLFKNNVKHFFKTHGKKIWGSQFDAAKLLLASKAF